MGNMDDEESDRNIDGGWEADYELLPVIKLIFPKFLFEQIKA